MCRVAPKSGPDLRPGLGDDFVARALVQQGAAELRLPVDDAQPVRLEQAVTVLSLVKPERLALTDELLEDLVIRAVLGEPRRPLTPLPARVRRAPRRRRPRGPSRRRSPASGCGGLGWERAPVLLVDSGPDYRTSCGRSGRVLLLTVRTVQAGIPGPANDSAFERCPNTSTLQTRPRVPPGRGRYRCGRPESKRGARRSSAGSVAPTHL